MSSEQIRDYSYEQFLHNDLQDPSLHLFGDPAITLMEDITSYNLPDDYFANPQQGGQSFYNDYGTTDYGDFNAFTVPTTSGLTPLDTGATFQSGQFVPGAANSRNQDYVLQTFENTAGHPQMDGSEAAQSFSQDIQGGPMPNIDVAQRSRVSPTGPIDCAPSPTSALSPLSPVSVVHVEWSGPQKCNWLGCASKATFHSRTALRAHIKKIHVTTLVCTHPGCSYKKPLGKQCDRTRHIATIHTAERGYPCLDSNRQELFSRKDKMMKHAKEKHELFKCASNHCSAIIFPSQRESHLQESHGHYKCAIGSCASGHGSLFTYESIKRHMRTIHRISPDPVAHLLNGLGNGDAEGVPLYAKCPLRPAYRDCAFCLPKSNEQ